MAVNKVKLIEKGQYRFAVGSNGTMNFIGGTSNPFSAIISGNCQVLSSMTVGTESTDNVECTGDIIAFLGSDIRKKKNIKKISKPLEKLKGINGYSFIWNEKATKKKINTKDLGVIAQEVEKVLPTAIRKNEIDGYLSVEYTKLIPLLIECIKEQQKQIEELKNKCLTQ